MATGPEPIDRPEPPALFPRPGLCEAAGLAVLALLAAWFLHASWRKWPDPVVDAGPQWYDIWRVSLGAAPYHDFLWNYGPLSLLFNGLLFKCFGPGMMVLVAANLTVYGAIVLLAYLAFRAAWGRLAAFAALAVFISVFSFSILNSVGNYNFATPYTHEATHGLVPSCNSRCRPVRLSDTDINRVSRIETSALRCLTVENETSFHELAKLESGELLVCTSYPGSATLAFLKKLPTTLQFWHFGDSDPEGFDILRDLRERSDRPFRALHMQWRSAGFGEHLTPCERRLLQALMESVTMQTEQDCLRQILNEGNKGSYEQESLGTPKSQKWPFYD